MQKEILALENRGSTYKGLGEAQKLALGVLKHEHTRQLLARAIAMAYEAGNLRPPRQSKGETLHSIEVRFEDIARHLVTMGFGDVAMKLAALRIFDHIRKWAANADIRTVDEVIKRRAERAIALAKSPKLQAARAKAEKIHEVERENMKMLSRERQMFSREHEIAMGTLEGRAASVQNAPKRLKEQRYEALKGIEKNVVDATKRSRSVRKGSPSK